MSVTENNDQKIALGNQLLRDLDLLGFSFEESRQVLREEIEAPSDLADGVAKYQVLKAKCREDENCDPGFMKEISSSKLQYGDYEVTGWMDKE